MKNAVLKFLRDEQGATAIEYGLIVGLIAGLIVATVTAIGVKIEAMFRGLCTAIGATAC